MGCGSSRTQVISLSDSANQRRQSSNSTNQTRPSTNPANQSGKAFIAPANQSGEAFSASANHKIESANATNQGTDLELHEANGITNHVSKELINEGKELTPNLKTKISDQILNNPTSERTLTEKTNCESTSTNMYQTDKPITTPDTCVADPTADENQSLKEKSQNIQETLEKAIPKVKPLTTEEVKEKYEAAIAKVTECINTFNTSPVFSESEEALKKFRANVFVFSRGYFALRGGPNADVIKLRREIGMLMYENKIVEKLCDMVVHGYQTESYKDSEGKIINSYYNVLKTSHIMLLNYSDACVQCGVGICEHETILKVIANKIKQWTQPHLNSDILEDENKMLKWSLGIIHNVAMMESSISQLRSLDYTFVLLPYLSSKQDMFRLSAMMALADIVEESNCELLQSSGQGIQFLLKVLKKALDCPMRKNLGFSAKELGRAVGRVARNDANKKSLVNEGALPLLVDLVKSAEDVIEEREAFESIWMLAFDGDNKEKMMQEPELMDLIVDRFSDSADSKVRKTCQGILWTLRNQLAVSNQYSHIGVKFGGRQEADVDRTPETPAQQTAGHVMISYQWADQTTLKQIRDRIKKGSFTVWMDIDNMGGSTLQAMAEAIEEATVVLVCMSQKYKNSPNCRAEAEYAFQKQKRIIPLIMEKGYRPDGWLGMILGSKLFYDFSGKYPFEVKVDGLLKELDVCFNKQAASSGGGDVTDSAVCEHPIVASRSEVYHGQQVSVESSDKVKTWSEADVSRWLQKHDLSQHRKLQDLSGREVSFLSKLRFEAPEYFYKTVENKLDVQSLLDLVKFIEAMDDLSSV